jgi:hypothetical protein
MAELKRTTEEVKESIGIKELGDIRSNLTGMDLFVDLAEKVSASMSKTNAGTSVPADASASVAEKTLSAEEAANPVRDGGMLKNEELNQAPEKS